MSQHQTSRAAVAMCVLGERDCAPQKCRPAGVAPDFSAFSALRQRFSGRVDLYGTAGVAESEYS
jgi:hypothetical protein